MGIVMYESAEEILVTELSKEETLKKSYFEEGGRDYEEYDRSVFEILEIHPKLQTWTY